MEIREYLERMGVQRDRATGEILPMKLILDQPAETYFEETVRLLRKHEKMTPKDRFDAVVSYAKYSSKNAGFNTCNLLFADFLPQEDDGCYTESSDTISINPFYLFYDSTLFDTNNTNYVNNYQNSTFSDKNITNTTFFDNYNTKNYPTNFDVNNKKNTEKTTFFDINNENNAPTNFDINNKNTNQAPRHPDSELRHLLYLLCAVAHETTHRKDFAQNPTNYVKFSNESGHQQRLEYAPSYRVLKQVLGERTPEYKYIDRMARVEYLFSEWEVLARETEFREMRKLELGVQGKRREGLFRRVKKSEFEARGRVAGEVAKFCDVLRMNHARNKELAQSVEPMWGRVGQKFGAIVRDYALGSNESGVMTRDKHQVLDEQLPVLVDLLCEPRFSSQESFDLLFPRVLRDIQRGGYGFERAVFVLFKLISSPYNEASGVQLGEVCRCLSADPRRLALVREGLVRHSADAVGFRLNSIDTAYINSQLSAVIKKHYEKSF